jgi:hypothetical protein
MSKDISSCFKKINPPNSAVNGEHHNNMVFGGLIFYTRLLGCNMAAISSRRLRES